jgi:hypothetical protein
MLVWECNGCDKLSLVNNPVYGSFYIEGDWEPCIYCCDSRATIVEMDIKGVESTGEFRIPGRGLVFTADRRVHDFELLDLLRQLIVVKNDIYMVTGIESWALSRPHSRPECGLLVRKVSG